MELFAFANTDLELDKAVLYKEPHRDTCASFFPDGSRDLSEFIGLQQKFPAPHWLVTMTVGKRVLFYVHLGQEELAILWLDKAVSDRDVASSKVFDLTTHKHKTSFVRRIDTEKPSRLFVNGERSVVLIALFRSHGFLL